MKRQVTIERLGHLGDGIAAGPIYVAGTLPGEVVEGLLDGSRLDQVRILTPSTDRVKPGCKHAKTCGGCSMQHAKESLVESWKAQIVKDALSAHGLECSIQAVHTSDAQSRRKTVLHGRRTKKGSIVGFFGKESESLVNVTECLVLDPTIMAIVPAMHEIVGVAASRTDTLDFAATSSNGGVDLAVFGGKQLDRALLEKLATIAGAHNLARLVWNDELIAMTEPPYQDFGMGKVLPPPGAFLQATRQGEAVLVKKVLDATAGARKVADLFAGCGTFSLPLCSNADVYAAESDLDALDAAMAGWKRAGGLHAFRTEQRDLFMRPLIAAELENFDAVVLDPPRAGAEAQVAQIAESKVNLVAYVSCNPKTFARDAKVLTEAGFVLGAIDIIDQFRWSPHVELVCALRRP